MLNERYSIRLASRNEGIEYIDDKDVYRFDVSLIDKVWRLYLPGSKGAQYEVHELDEEEKRRVLPRVIKYLETIKYLGFFPRRYSVIIERKKRSVV
jgi:hypothetical protein